MPKDNPSADENIFELNKVDIEIGLQIIAQYKNINTQDRKLLGIENIFKDYVIKNDIVKKRIEARDKWMATFVRRLKNLMLTQTILDKKPIANLCRGIDDSMLTGSYDYLLNYIIPNQLKAPLNIEHRSLINQFLVFIEKNESIIQEKIAMHSGQFVEAKLNVQLKALLVEINIMLNYGIYSKYGKHKPTIKLAQALGKRVIDFRQSKNVNDSNAIATFKTNFIRHLHTQDHLMNNNRGFFKFFGTETTRAYNIRQVETLLNNIGIEETACCGCFF